MGRHIPKANSKGSQGDIQRLVEHNPALLTRRVKSALDLSATLDITWVSPQPPRYTEYSDADFLGVLGLDTNRIRLHEFWPKGGPHWDALGRGSDDTVFLVEAKAHIGEIVSTPTGAGGTAREQIVAQLNEEFHACEGACGLDHMLLPVCESPRTSAFPPVRLPATGLSRVRLLHRRHVCEWSRLRRRVARGNPSTPRFSGSSADAADAVHGGCLHRR